MASEQETKDLAELQVKLNECARGCMDALRNIYSLDTEQLGHRGHKTHAAAAQSTYEYYQKKMDRLINDHLKKYPD